MTLSVQDYCIFVPDVAMLAWVDAEGEEEEGGGDGEGGHAGHLLPLQACCLPAPPSHVTPADHPSSAEEAPRLPAPIPRLTSILDHSLPHPPS